METTQPTKWDIIVIIISIIAIAACVYTLSNVASYQNKINDAWLDNWQEICSHGSDDVLIIPNITFNYRGVYNP